MIKKVALTAALAALGLVTTLEYVAVAQSNRPTTQQSPTNRPTTPSNSSQLSATDTRFILQAHQGNMAEVALSRLALAPGRNASPDVRQYAQMMVQEHPQADARLLQLAQRKGVTIPQSQALDAEHQQTSERLAQLSGRNFDRAYMRAMVTDHLRTVALFQQQAQRGQDPDVRAFATQLLPSLRQHLQMARAMADDGGQQGPRSPRQ
jgi:putative membrane protein